MKESKFKTFMVAAESIGGDYSVGYQRGLRRFFHGESFGTVADHEKWIGLDGHRKEMGDGYRDGFLGKPPKGFHGMLGNKNAQIGELPADSWLQVRLNSQVKSKYVKQAQKEGMNLSAWIIKTLNKNSADHR